MWSVECGVWCGVWGVCLGLWPGLSTISTSASASISTSTSISISTSVGASTTTTIPITTPTRIPITTPTPTIITVAGTMLNLLVADEEKTRGLEPGPEAQGIGHHGAGEGGRVHGKVARGAKVKGGGHGQGDALPEARVMGAGPAVVGEQAGAVDAEAIEGQGDGVVLEPALGLGVDKDGAGSGALGRDEAEEAARAAPARELQHPRGQVVVCQYDFNFHLTYVNPAFARMLGYSREELVGQPLKRIAHPGIPQALLDDIRATTGRGQPWRGMAKTLRRDGGYVWSESLIIPVLKRGEVTGYMSIRSEASPQRIAAEEQRYRDIHAGARRYHEGRGPDWTRVTAFHLLAALGAAATLSALCAGLLWWAPAWLAGREGGLAALAGGCWLLTLLSARWLGRRTLRGLGYLLKAEA